MKKITLMICWLLLQGGLAFSQIAINLDGSAPDPSAGLDISYTDKGLLIPRLNFEQRNAIQNPAQGLIIYCTDCSTGGKGVLSIYEGTGWKTLELRCDPPSIPAPAEIVASTHQITWEWDTAPIALGYRFSVDNDFETAIELGNITTFTESNLECNTLYLRYIWAYNQCGISTPLILEHSTEQIPLSGSPVEGVHASTLTTITWNWGTVDGASGYKWNVVNDYGTAFDKGTSTTWTETGLECGTNYTRYVWAYNECGISSPRVITFSTGNEPADTPVAANPIPDSYSITWTWHPVAEADGYKWNTINDYDSALEIDSDTSFTEVGLECMTPYTRYIWAFNNCGISVAVMLNASTTGDVHPAPTPAAPNISSHQVTWNWHPLSGHFSKFKWNTVNNYSTAVDVQTDTTYTESGLSCNTFYGRYVWAYDDCGVSDPITLSATTSLFPPSNPVAGTHVPEPDQIVWHWNPVADATGYKWSTTNNANGALDLGNVTSYTENGLTCNTSYTRYVWAYSNCGVSISTSLTQNTALDPPDAPVAATHETYPTLIIWNWNIVEGATGYKWGTTNNFAQAMEMGVATSKIETGLTCNTNYTRYIWAYGPCGVSDATVMTQMSAQDPPSSPVEGTHEPMADQIIWHWYNGSGAQGYLWNTENDIGSAQDMGMALQKTESDLDCNTSYIRYVWAYSNCGVSAPIDLVQTTSLDPPAPPTAATHVPAPSQVTWNWNPVTGATGYKWNTTNSESTAINLNLATTYTETGLNCNTSYIRYVWAYSDCGTSTAASLSQITSLDPPDAPTAATHTSTASQIVWNWNPVGDATGYKWNTTNNLGTATDVGTATTRTETGLNCNTSYTRYIWAYSNCGTSTAATITKATVTEVPNAPSAATHTASNTQVIWNWNAVAGVTGYRWNTVNDYATAVNVGNVTTYTENNLTCGTSYTRYVWSYNNCANSSSVSLVKTTASNPPGNPVAGTHNPAGTQIVWNWSAVGGATCYYWNNTNDFATAVNIGSATSKTETGLACATSYTRYLWAYNGCASSSAVPLTASTTQDPPPAPGSGTHNSNASQVVWNWTTVPAADGYKWNSVNIYSTATDVGLNTSYTENGLSCNTTYTRFVWAYNACGVSTSIPLTQTTSSDPPAAPTQGTNVVTPDQITWNWNSVPGAEGYKWSATNDFSTAEEMGTATFRLETGLACATSYTRYVWAYHSCGTSTPLTMTQTTSACFVCGTDIVKNHVAGTVAPVTKTTTYGTVTNIPGATSKCWITSNLGSDHQATALTDDTEASAGWYWQFNRIQGFKHDGTTRTPNTTWIAYINEYGGWASANDPCTSELGTGWRLPTSTEWSAIDNAGNWSNWNGPWESDLKLHAAGYIDATLGTLSSRGTKGYQWSSTQSSYNHMGMVLYYYSGNSSTTMYGKAYGYSIRCLKD